MCAQKPNQIKSKEAITFIQKGIATSESELATAEKEYKRKAADISTLESELKEVEKQLQDAKAALETEAGKELKLAAEQLQEYNRLKVEAGSRGAPLRVQQDKLKRELKIEKVMQLQRSRIAPTVFGLQLCLPRSGTHGCAGG